MSDTHLDAEEKQYRDVLDALVAECREGQGQIGSRRARARVWNQCASPDVLPDQHAVNLFLASLPPHHLEVLAELLSDQFSNGVHQTLVTLHEHGIKPFDAAYEGTPFHDFVGRLMGWQWPAPGTRSR